MPLFELNFTELKRDFRLENVDMQGGDLRFSGSKVGGGITFNRINIIDAPINAIIGQSCFIGGGFQISGTLEHPSQITGNIQLMGSKITSDLTFVDVQVGQLEKNADTVLRDASIEKGLNLVRCSIFGQLNASSAIVGRDVHFHSSNFIKPHKIACDIRGIKVGGEVQFATLSGNQDCRIDGYATADRLQANSFNLNKLHLAKETKLGFSNMRIEGGITLHQIIAEGDGFLDFSGTNASSLEDSVSDEIDGWGGGKLKLNVDGFDYKHLDNPSGVNNDEADSIRYYRREWLSRSSPERMPRAYRHLAKVLRGQGLHEASRRLLINAFEIEGHNRTSIIGKTFSYLFGLFFGHGLSGSKAFFTLVAFWMLGAYGSMYLQSHDLLIASPDRSQSQILSCKEDIEPHLYAADLMIPIVNLGYENRCEVGRGAQYDYKLSIFIFGASDWSLPAWRVARFLSVIYIISGWIIVSLSIATWSGIFRNAGRD